MVNKNPLLKNSKGVLYCSPKGTSGYAEAGKRMVFELLNQNIAVSWYQFDTNSKADETDPIYQETKKSINKNIDFDTAIFQCDPETWKKHIDKFKIKFIGKKLIGYPSWETNKVPELWVKNMNLMDEIWVPSKFNKEIFEHCGVSVPVKIVPVPFIRKKLPEINADSLTSLLMQSRWYGNESKLFRYGEDWKIFYTIGEWNDRKNMEDVINVFCKTFTIEDRVKLIIKTFHEDYSNKNVNYCICSLENILKKFKFHPEILLITSELFDNDILFLHSIGNCYYSLSHGEGFCIPALDAFNYGKNVIITNFGGQIDYLGNNYKGLVDCDLINVNCKDKPNIYSGDQKWADPNPNVVINKLKEEYLKPNPTKKSNIVLSSGWYFKEQKNGKIFRQSSSESEIKINTDSDYIRLKLEYEIGKPKKILEVIIDSTIKKQYSLIKDVSQNILIPSRGVKSIELLTPSDVPEKYDKSLWDHRNVGIILYEVELIKENQITSLSVNDIEVENELTDFYFLSTESKIIEELKQEVVCFENDKNNKINLVKIEVGNDSEFKGITYIGQFGTSGYATAAKGNLVHFFTRGIPISWIPLYFDNSTMSDDCFYNAMVKSLINKQIDFHDTVIIHSTPDIWSELKEKNKVIVKGKKQIGYTVWETSKLPYSWVESINENVDEVWCPSTYNRLVFKSSGVKIPIKVFPHVFLQKELPNREVVNLKFYNKENVARESKYYTFYNISELNPRKGVEDLVKVFCEAFTSKDKVRLILKVHYKNYEESNKKYCINVLNNIICNYKDPPRIYYILNNLTEREILGLHSIGDCYISLCKSEGFGLTIFEAYKYGKQIITTGYGGQVDFLGKDYEGLVQYKLDNVTGMKEFSKWYSEDQQWAYPVLDHARDLMMLVAK